MNQYSYSKNKVILLDIDGVMIKVPSWKPVELHPDGFGIFDDAAVANLNNIIEITGASIILTTSHKSNYNIPQWENIFINRGIYTRISKLLNNISSNIVNRSDEILQWVSENNDSNYVIIDDDKSLNELPINIKSHLVQTYPLIGLSKNNAELAIDILSK